MNNNPRGDGPRYVYGDRDSDPPPRLYPAGTVDNQVETITRPCRVIAAHATNNAGPLNMSIEFEATDGNEPLPTVDTQANTMTVNNMVFWDNVPPQVNDTGYTLVFERPDDSTPTTPYVYVITQRP